MKVYLAGPIRNGNVYDITWRKQCKIYLKAHKIEAYDPTEDMVCHSDKWIYKTTRQPINEELMVKKDIDNLKASDILLINWLANDAHLSIGSFAEFGMGMILGKVIIVVTTDFRIQHHPFITQGATLVVDNFDDAEKCILMYKTLHDFKAAEGTSLISSLFMQTH